MFIAINLIKDNNEAINKFPIIYENNDDVSSIVDQITSNEVFSKYISKNVSFKEFEKTTMHICYVVDTETSAYYENSLNLKDIFSMDKLYNWENYIRDSIEYLYECSYKNKPSKSESIQGIFDKIKAKYPNKINKEVVINYICSDLKEKYKFIGPQLLSNIRNDFNENIIEL